MDNLSLRFFILLAVICSTTFSSVASVQFAMLAPNKPQGVVRFHGCNQNTCNASATASKTTDPSAALTVLRTNSSAKEVCFQITHNEENFALKVISSSLILFEKLMRGMDCTSVNAALFRKKHFANQKVKLISQKQGLPTHTRYLAGNNTTGSLFLTDSRNTNNMFKFRRLIAPGSNY